MDTSIFVGRRQIIESSIDFLNGLLTATVIQSPRFITIQGAGGIGKTKILLKIRERVLAEGLFDITQVIDLKATANRSTISLMQTIVTTLVSDYADEAQVALTLFQEFLEAVKNYNIAREQEKYSLYETIVETFVKCCLAASKQQPFVILLDTFESIQDFDLNQWLLTLLPRLGGRVGIVIAGRLPIPLKNVQVLPLELTGLSDTEIEQLGRQLFKKRDIERDYDLTSDIIQGILQLTDGLPILVVLALEWILENVEPDAIISIPKANFESEIVKYLKYLESDEDVVVIMMATIDRRLTPRIMSLITQWEIEKCIEISANLTRFSFVKTIEQNDEKDRILTLHDEMLRLVGSYADFPLETKFKWCKSVVDLFYEEAVSISSDPQAQQILVAEKLHYQLRYDPDAAIQTFDSEVRTAVENYEFEFCNLLLTEVNSRDVSLNEKQKNIVDLNYAELLVKSYKPFDAKNLLDSLITSFDAESDTSYFSRALSAYGACIANGATLIEANLTEAINLLKKNLKACQDKGLNDRVATILYELGYCYDILGYNDETLDYFEQSNKLARKINDTKLITRTLDEMGKLRLRRYEVSPALELFQESLKLKEQNEDATGLGASYHYVANAYRDLDNFPEALRWYGLAEKARLQVADTLGLCELYSDIAWIYLLEKKWDDAIANLNKCYYQYAIPGHFGREIADAEHSFYHIKLELEGLSAALPWIEKSFVNAEKYSNTFIYLDAALHLIEAAYEMKEYDKIPSYYQKMQELDEKGCGYRAFKGRAVNVLGDIAYDRRDFSSALDHWEEGYTIIAIHGRSRSSVKRFDDLLYERSSKIIDVLRHLEIERVERFLHTWQNTVLEPGSVVTLDQEYPGMGGIIKLALGDQLGDTKEYLAAIKWWYSGLFDIAIHLVKKQTSNVLKIEDYLLPRKSEFELAIKHVEPTNVLFFEASDTTNWAFDRNELNEIASVLALIKSNFVLAHS